VSPVLLRGGGGLEVLWMVAEKERHKGEGGHEQGSGNWDSGERRKPWQVYKTNCFVLFIPSLLAI